MRVISVPGRIRWICLALLVAVLLAGWEALLVPRAAWWRVPPLSVALSCVAALAAVLPAIWALLTGKRWALHWVTLVGVAWVALSIGWFVRFSNTAVGFFSVLLAAYWVVMRGWVALETGRSFYDPRIRWFQGLPKPVPGLEGALLGTQGKTDCRIGRIDEDGVFVFIGKGRKIDPIGRRTLAELQLSYRGRSVRCTGLPVTALEGRQGIGFQFTGMTPDVRKSLGDFIEMLRGEGHV